MRIRLSALLIGAVAFAGLALLGPRALVGRATYPTATLTSEPVDQQLTSLQWNTHNVSRCVAAGAWSGPRATSGSERIPMPATDSVYELSCSGEQGDADARVTVAAGPGTSPAFPLRWSRSGRYLVDARDRPFLIHGDAAWSLIAELKNEEVVRYLDDRRARGFNTVLVNLLERKFASRAPRNAYGQAPFARSNFIPNDAYFEHAEWVVQQAAQRGILVLLTPAYLGYGGQEEGWYKELIATDRAALSEYGRYLGRRFQRYDNIIWVHGGDYNPPDRSIVEAIATGIREFDQRMCTAHTAPESSARDVWGQEPWLRLDNIYTYKNVIEKASAAYARTPVMPFFLLESSYENEQTDEPSVVRAHAYQALLSGAAGHIFGNNPIWHFSGPGSREPPRSWPAALDSAGSRSMSELHKLFGTYAWWSLLPDGEHRLMRRDDAQEADRAVAATAIDRDFAFIYVPQLKTVQVNPTALDCTAGCRATWFDPSTGAYGPTLSLNSAQPASLRPPARNGTGDEDWVLIIAASR